MTTDIEFDRVNQMTEEFDYCADRVLTGIDPYPDGEHGLADIRIMEAIYRAAHEETGVDIDLGRLSPGASIRRTPACTYRP